MQTCQSLATLSGFRCVVVDPPWPLDTAGRRTFHGKIKPGKWNDPRQDNKTIRPLPYPVMTLDEIAGLRIPAAYDAHLYLWTTNRFLEDAYGITRAWGFRPATLLTWCKAPMGLGLGGTYCNAAEFCIFARRGNLPALRRIDRNWWQWKRGRHSAKPEELQDIIETVSPAPRLEMFARRPRPGWIVWGNEAGGS